MIPHWDLIPGEEVTLICLDGRASLAATYLWRDTLSACFQAGGTRCYFRLQPNEHVFLERSGGQRYTVAGEERRTRTEIDTQPGRRNRRSRAIWPAQLPAQRRVAR